jgi:hypothetical protein
MQAEERGITDEKIPSWRKAFESEKIGDPYDIVSKPPLAVLLSAGPAIAYMHRTWSAPMNKGTVRLRRQVECDTNASSARGTAIFLMDSRPELARTIEADVGSRQDSLP